MKSIDKARVLLVGEDRPFLSMLENDFEVESAIDIIEIFESAEQAIASLDSLCPNIIIADVTLAEMSGVEACRNFLENAPDCDVIVLGDTEDHTGEALRSGAAWYFPKQMDHRELVTVIKLICKWQSLKSKWDSSVSSIRQIESMIIEHLTKFENEGTAPDDGFMEIIQQEVDNKDMVKEITLIIPLPYDVSQYKAFSRKLGSLAPVSAIETTNSVLETRIAIRMERPSEKSALIGKLRDMEEVKNLSELPVRTRRTGIFRKKKAVCGCELQLTLKKARVQPELPAPDFRDIEEPGFVRETAGTVIG